MKEAAELGDYLPLSFQIPKEQENQRGGLSRSVLVFGNPAPDGKQ